MKERCWRWDSPTETDVGDLLESSKDRVCTRRSYQKRLKVPFSLEWVSPRKVLILKNEIVY